MSNHRVLLVDPRPGWRGRIAGLLTPHCSVTRCRNPEEARQHVARLAPDLVLVSLRQLTGNGFQLTKQLRSDGLTRDRMVVVYGSPGKLVDEQARRRLERLWSVDRLVMDVRDDRVLLETVQKMLERKSKGRVVTTPPPAGAQASSSPGRVVSASRESSGAARRGLTWKEVLTSEVSVDSLRRLFGVSSAPTS